MRQHKLDLKYIATNNINIIRSMANISSLRLFRSSCWQEMLDIILKSKIFLNYKLDFVRLSVDLIAYLLIGFLDNLVYSLIKLT